MTTKIIPLAPALLALAVLSSLSGASCAAGRLDVPVSQMVLPNGDPRYSVPVSVGNGPAFEAQLDTGSFGLRVLASALEPGNYEATDLHRGYAFGSGAKFDGVLARGTISVGGAATEAPVLFHLVQRVACVDDKPDCPAARLKQQEYRIGGDGYAGQGFPAILGLSMLRAATDDSAQNPLTATGPRSWILVLPRPGRSEPGHLIIDPDESDRAGFTLLKLETPDGGRLAGWADRALPGCLEDGGQRFCGRTLLDSGAPGVSVATDTVKSAKPWGKGHLGRIEIGGDNGPVSVPFRSGADYSTRVILHPQRGPDGAAQLAVGTLPYFSYAVLYDSQAGTIGFKARDPNEP
ncbi:MAG: hypothetical protein ACRYGP_19595 [Janthinobacterium lividum]